MNSLNPNKTQSQVSVATNSGFFWTNNKVINFEKRTIKNGIPFIEQHKGIVLWPKGECNKKELKKILKTLKTGKVKTLSEMNLRTEAGL